jgi:hypothetical protein
MSSTTAAEPSSRSPSMSSTNACRSSKRVSGSRPATRRNFLSPWPIYPPRPHFLTLTPAPDLHSGHASPSFRFGEWVGRSGPDAPSREFTPSGPLRHSRQARGWPRRGICSPKAPRLARHSASVFLCGLWAGFREQSQLDHCSCFEAPWRGGRAAAVTQPPFRKVRPTVPRLSAWRRNSSRMRRPPLPCPGHRGCLGSTARYPSRKAPTGCRR